MSRPEGSSDVTVVGAGPAGLSAALTLLRAGVRVTLMAPTATFLSRRELVDSVPPEFEATLLMLGIDSFALQRLSVGTFHAITRNGITHPFGRTASAATCGWHIERSRFDSYLLDAALGLGLKYCEGQVHDVKIDPTSIVLERASRAEHTPWAIDATGRSTLFARMGLTQRLSQSPEQTAWRGIDAGQAVDKELHPIFDSDDDCWSWSAKLDDGRRSQVWATTGRGKPPASWRNSTKGSIIGADITWHLCRPVAGLHFRIAGDAACALDPRCGRGVLFAIQSGIAAANSILAARREPRAGPLAAVAYDQFVVEHFMRRAKDIRSSEDPYALK